MDTRQIEITCPCCQTRLSIDVRTQQVMRSAPAAELDAEGKPKVGDADWTRAISKVRERSTSGADRMDAALESERSKTARLEERFREARRKLEQSGDEPPSG